MKHSLHRSGSLAALLLVVAGCSPKSAPPPPPAAAPSAAPAAFTIIPNDLAGIAEVTTKIARGTNNEYIVHILFTDEKAGEFRAFTRAHINQRVRLIIGHKVVAEPVIAAEITNGQADVSFASAREARAIIDALGKPKTAAGATPAARLPSQISTATNIP